MKMLESYIDKIKQNDYSSFKSEVILNLDRCLTILNGAYTTITEKAPTGTIPEMVGNELGKATANRGRTSEELYQEFATTLIVSTLGEKKRIYCFLDFTKIH